MEGVMNSIFMILGGGGITVIGVLCLNEPDVKGAAWRMIIGGILALAFGIYWLIRFDLGAEDAPLSSPETPPVDQESESVWLDLEDTRPDKGRRSR
jgi:hypothetical protein